MSMMHTGRPQLARWVDLYTYIKDRYLESVVWKYTGYVGMCALRSVLFIPVC